MKHIHSLSCRTYSPPPPKFSAVSAMNGYGLDIQGLTPITSRQMAESTENASYSTGTMGSFPTDNMTGVWN
jgi:hypothetical protein